MEDFTIISAVNDNNKYMSFITTVSQMWFNITGKKMVLGFITNRDKSDKKIIELREKVDLRIFKPINHIPSPNQAKVTRMYLATQIVGKSMLVDLDMYVLNDKVLEWCKSYKEKKITTIGSNAYYNSPSTGKFPMCYTIGDGYIFKSIVNSNNYDYEKLLNSWCNIKTPIDYKEQISNNPNKFSDESLLRCLIKETNNEKNIINIFREDFVGMTAMKRIDRVNMKYDKQKLYDGYYVDCAPNRPLIEDEMTEIFDYLKIK